MKLEGISFRMPLLLQCTKPQKVLLEAVYLQRRKTANLLNNTSVWLAYQSLAISAMKLSVRRSVNQLLGQISLFLPSFPWVLLWPRNWFAVEDLKLQPRVMNSVLVTTYISLESKLCSSQQLQWLRASKRHRRCGRVCGSRLLQGCEQTSKQSTLSSQVTVHHHHHKNLLPQNSFSSIMPCLRTPGVVSAQKQTPPSTKGQEQSQ